MRRVSRLSLLCLAASVAGARAQEPPFLQVGVPVSGNVHDSDPVVETDTLREYTYTTIGTAYRIRVDRSGNYHIDLHSYDFDGYLVLLDGDGELIAEDDDGWVEFHPRIQTHLEAQKLYRVHACALHGERGEFELRLLEGVAEQLPDSVRTVADLAEARQRLAHAEKTYGVDHLKVAGNLNDLAYWLLEEGRTDEARDLYLRAISIFEENPEADEPEFAITLNDLATLLDGQGLHNDARPLYERALALWEKDPEAGEEVANTLNNLAVLLRKQGYYEDARERLETALSMNENMFGKQNLRTSRTLYDLADLMQEQGFYAAARPLSERALAIREKHAGTDLAVANSANQLAILLTKLGHYDAARPLLERAIAIWQEKRGSEHPDVAVGLNNLAQLLERQGLYLDARPLYDRALVIWENEYGARHVAVAKGLSNLAGLLRKQGLDEEARTHYERALAIKEEVYGAEHTSVAITLHNLARLHYDENSYEEAQPLYEKALTIWERKLGPEHPYVADASFNLALLHHDQRDHVRALAYYERALAIQQSTLEPEHPKRTRTLNGLATLHGDMGDAMHAWELLYQAYSNTLRHLKRVLASQSEQENFRYLATVSYQLEDLLGFARVLDDGRVHTLTYESILSWKGQVARLRLASREQLRGALTEAQKAIVEEIRARQSELSALVWSEKPGDAVDEARLEILRARLNELELAWQRSIEAEPESAVRWSELQTHLPPRTAVVDFFVHGVRRAEARANDWQAKRDVGKERRLSAWIARPDRDHPIHLDLGLSEQVERETRAFLEELVARRGVAFQGQASEDDDGDSVLRALLWGPIAKHVSESDLIIVSPDRYLGTLPFEVLRTGEGRYLLEKYAFTYLQDVSSLLQATRRAPNYGTLLSVGGIDFRSRAEYETVNAGPGGMELSFAVPNDALRGGFDYWERLPATLGESQTVLDLHEDSFRSQGERTLVQHELATEERLKQELPEHAVAHLATHGFFQPKGLTNMWEEALDDSGERELRLREPMRRLLGSHPGLLSGLVCAGANADLEEGRDDGYLTAAEVGWLDLSNVELVVLSACQTGLGRARSGEGLLGLRRAFRIAGAKTVVSSLWTVRDESTAELMRGFYKNLWVARMGKLEALRTAQLEMLKSNRIAFGQGRPSTWGAFVLSGDWR